MGPDDDLGLPFCFGVTALIAVARAQRDPDSQGFQPAAKSQVMLFRQDLGRCHQRRLTAGADG